MDQAGDGGVTSSGGEEVALSAALARRLAACWDAARFRAVDYLMAAGLDQAAAAATAEALVARVRQLCPADDLPLSAAAAVRLVLKEADVVLASGAGSEAGELLTPSTTPVQIRRQTLLPALRWRRGRWLPRPVLIPRETRKGDSRVARGHADVLPLDTVARIRRSMFLVLILTTAVWGVWTLAEILGQEGLSLVDLIHLGVFSLLMLWLSQSFWTLAAGFWVLMARLWTRGRAITPPKALGEGSDLGRVAIVMPIYNEDTERVFTGLTAMWKDLRREAPDDRRIDLFILADSTDPDVWLAEIDAWNRLRHEVGDIDRIFYRRRDRNIGRKTGNIEDFLTRYGASYESMIVLDADSLMTAAAMLELIRRMDANPRVGLIQAPPKLVRGQTLFARVLQLAGELYGPLAASGLAFWARGEGNYWGHNAVIRVRPFMELCGLPNLPGRAPLGGPILSHDFVEAALIRRGGWQVWIADDLGGSYEEPPPTIEDFAVRDRRWCQGNLQHARVAFARHLHWASRLHLVIGIMSYVTSPLWLVFLILSAMQAWTITHTQPIYFTEGWPFPTLPVSVGEETTLLLVTTLSLLFLPKILGLILALVDSDRRRILGGGPRLVLSALIETFYSALLAPIMMLMHTWFVVSILLGVAIEWKPQRRDAKGGQLRAALASFIWPTLIGIAAAAGSWIWTPLLFWWLVPVTAGLILAVPIALAGASEQIGQALARRHLLLVAEDVRPPAVMWDLDKRIPSDRSALDRFVRAVMEPAANGLHLQLLRTFRTQPLQVGQARRFLERKAIHLGPASLEKAERRAVLEDPELMEALHIESWVEWPEAHPEAVSALRQQRTAPALPTPPDGPHGSRHAA